MHSHEAAPHRAPGARACGRCDAPLARRNQTGMCSRCWRAVPLFVRTMPVVIALEHAVVIAERLAKLPEAQLLEVLLAALPPDRLPPEYRRLVARIVAGDS